MSLTPRQRTKVNAALSLIALHGHNPREVQAVAKRYESQRLPTAEAYSKALEWFAGKVPAMRESLSTILELVQYSDDATLAQYDAALDAFNQTGDNAELEALAPMIVGDFKALVVKKGLATEEEVAAEDWDISYALGVTEESFAAEPWQPTPEDISPPANQADNAQEGDDMRPLTNPGQISPLASPTGYRPGDKRTAAPAAAPTASAAPTIRNGQAYVPGQFTATGYRPALRGDKAREFAGTPIRDPSAPEG